MNNWINAYNPALPLEQAVTPPSAWYTEEAFAKFEEAAVFGHNWLMAARVDEFQKEGDYVATEVGGQPIIIVKSDEIRGFYNVCRHHAAEIMNVGSGCARTLNCPYHGWSYELNGKLRGTPQFAGTECFNKEENGLVLVRVAVW